jgi:hypothetical protein
MANFIYLVNHSKREYLELGKASRCLSSFCSISDADLLDYLEANAGYHRLEFVGDNTEAIEPNFRKEYNRI